MRMSIVRREGNPKRPAPPAFYRCANKCERTPRISNQSQSDNQSEINTTDAKTNCWVISPLTLEVDVFDRMILYRGFGPSESTLAHEGLLLGIVQKLNNLECRS